MSSSVKPAVSPKAFVVDVRGCRDERRRRGRPAGRCPARDEPVQAGIAAFAEPGFASAGIEAVSRQVGAPKGSFHHHFCSKREFGLAVIDGYARHYADKLARLFGDPAVPLFERFGRRRQARGALADRPGGRGHARPARAQRRPLEHFMEFFLARLRHR